MKVCISALVDSIEGFWVLTNYKVDNGSGVMVLTHNMQRSAPLVAGVRKARGYAFTINLIVPRRRYTSSVSVQTCSSIHVGIQYSRASDTNYTIRSN